MQIKIITGAWGRHRLFDFFCRWYQSLQNKIDFELIIACSEQETLDIARKYGHIAFMFPNDPLHRKFNAAAEVARGADYCIMIGSDDFITEPLLRFYTKVMKKRYDYIGVLDWYFFDTKTKKGLYWGGYNQPYNIGKPCGAGRTLSKNLLDKMNWQPWHPKYDRNLDTGMQLQLDANYHTEYLFKMRDRNLFGLDIKTEQNMTFFDVWPNSTLFDGKEMLDTYIPKYTEEIMKLW